MTELSNAVYELTKQWVSSMERIKIKEGLRIAMEVSAVGNKFLQDHQPWVHSKTNRTLCASLVAAGIGLCKLLGALFQVRRARPTAPWRQQGLVCASCWALCSR